MKTSIHDKSGGPNKESERTPIEVARACQRLPGFVFLDSSTEVQPSLSLLAWAPEFVVAGGPEDWPRLEMELAKYSASSREVENPNSGAIGWLGFDGRFCFGFYDRLFRFDHTSGTWNQPLPELPEIPPSCGALPEFHPKLGQNDYEQMVHRAKDYIAAGDIYQVCLSYPFVANGRFDAFRYYEALRKTSPAPHAAYLNLGGRQVASASPELFLRMCGQTVTTRPIKGTRPRFQESAQDERSAYELVTSPKEIAELVMITDLERNDLGRICEFGSVHVPALLQLERFQQVHHLVSTVSGTLREEVTHAGALRLCSPGGSISGAPKLRALEIIGELEPYPRGLYTGAIGYFGCNGESQFSIAIRTAVFESNSASFSVGAGIVADSVPCQEWEETLHKASGLLSAAKIENLIVDFGAYQRHAVSNL